MPMPGTLPDFLLPLNHASALKVEPLQSTVDIAGASLRAGAHSVAAPDDWRVRDFGAIYGTLVPSVEVAAVPRCRGYEVKEGSLNVVAHPAPSNRDNARVLQ